MALGYGVGLWSGATLSPGLGRAISVVSPAEARDLTYASPQAAYEQGLGAYKSGYYEIAKPALEYVAAKGDVQQKFMAEFYLARIYADNVGSHTDHALAYMLYQRIADEYADIDPDDLRRAPFVAKALTAVAIYVRDGLPEIALKPDVERAKEYLRHAATFFNEADAQFELVKIYIGEEAERRTGLHFLGKLASEGHPAAQAVLADLMARGRHVPQDLSQALAMIKLAVANASASDRIWIEDTYQKIYCGASADVREKSKTFVATWSKKFTQPRSPVEQSVGSGRSGELSATRVCANGERLELNRATSVQPPAAVPPGQPPPAMLGIVPSGSAVRDPATGRPPAR